MEVDPVELKCLAFDLAFHPTSRLLAVGDISGDVRVFGVDADKGAQELFSSSYHTDSCRAVAFSADGAALYSTGTDRGIQATDVDTGKALGTMASAHGEAINAVHVMSETNIATGDDGGTVKVWDLRTRGCVAEYDEHADFIAGLATTEHHAESLLAASGDGTVSVMDWRAKDVELSYQLEDEPLCLAVMKCGGKVVVGTQEGSLGVYAWGDWEDVQDRVPGHPTSVDTMARLSEDTMVTGAADGVLRLVDVLPNRIRGVVGEHSGFPIEALALSADGELLASCSHDKMIKFWNVKGLGAASGGPPPEAAGGFFDDL